MSESVDLSSTSAADWWRQAVVYQIYPRSFSDANGDGLGDLAGITARVPYLQKLGVDAVWLSPFYPSQLADGGYDVDDYRDVDPKLGTLADFDDMSKAIHDAGMKLIVDIVPNHTSDQHEWFKAALKADKGSPERDRYIFRDGLGDSGELPPADWTSTFGGPGWHPAGDGQWYFHYFAPEQPDLNWKNREVRDDFLRTLRFWADRGVDGFRVDVAHGLAKDLPAPGSPLPSQAELDQTPIDGNHPLWDRDDVHDIYAEWRQVFNEYNPPRVAVAEAWVAADRRAQYASQQGLGQAFNFDLLEADLNAEQFKEIITFNLDLAQQVGSSSTWVLSNHDVVRHPTRYGLPPRGTDTKMGDNATKAGADWLKSGGTTPPLDRVGGLRKGRAATLLELALPGSTYVYQGEELGLHEVAEIAPEQRQDPIFFRTHGEIIGRDGCRVPLPWTNEPPSYGFSTSTAHLPQPKWFADFAVSVEDDVPDSTLTLYRAAIALRRQLETTEEMTWLDLDNDQVLAFARPNGWVSVTNFGDQPVALPAGNILLASESLTDQDQLPGATTVWLQR